MYEDIKEDEWMTAEEYNKEKKTQQNKPDEEKKDDQEDPTTDPEADIGFKDNTNQEEEAEESGGSGWDNTLIVN